MGRKKFVMGPSKVLVVEDHPVSRKMLEAMLRKTYLVISAASGTEALALAKETKPDLVLLDIDMPEMDGFQTLDMLRRGVIDEAAPVIFLTAREDAASREQGLEAGAVDYLTKPYDRQELTIKVKNHLALYEARKEIEARNRIMAREMEMASQLQSALLPTRFPVTNKLDFAVAYRPVSKAGGDFFDVIEMPDSYVGFAQVDVSGHGVASAMIGAMFKMVFQSAANNYCCPSTLLSNMNEQLFQVLPDSDFLTVFYGVIDLASLELVFSNAGHPKPFLYRCKTGDIEELSSGGPLIGAFPGMRYDEASTVLQPGDKILIFTDGITEAVPVQTDMEFYGEDRLRRVFLELVDRSAEEIVQKIVGDLETFRGSTIFEDDVTMMVICVR
jgi:serine phosphatase RsbU (regulator of sigma subunit)